MEIDPTFAKSLEKIKEAQTKELLKEQLLLLQKDPFRGKQLSGNLNGIYSLGFGSRPQWRISYLLEACPICKQNLPNRHSCSCDIPNEEASPCVATIYVLDFKKREDAYKK